MFASCTFPPYYPTMYQVWKLDIFYLVSFWCPMKNDVENNCKESRTSLSRRTISSIHYYRSYIGLRQVTCTHITCHNFIFSELKARGIWDADIILPSCCLPKTYVMNLSYCKTLAILHSHWDRRRMKGNNVTNWSYISMILGDEKSIFEDSFFSLNRVGPY